MYRKPLLLSAVALTTMLSLSGCTEVSALTKDVGTSVGQGVSTMMKDFTTGLTTPTQAKPQSQKAATIPATDMIFLMGWMEDACEGSVSPYDKISKRYYAFSETVIDMDNSRAKPASQWSSQYRHQIQNIVKSKEGSYVTFTLQLNNAYYRNQPLKAIEIGYREGTEGAHTKLVFSSSTSVPAIISNFKTRKVEGMYGVYDGGVTYNARENSLSCEL